MKKARVVVTIRKDVLDPAGAAVKNALAQRGITDLRDVRIGKVIDITFNERAKDNDLMIEEVARTILSNPIMEDVAIEVFHEPHDVL